MRKLVATLACRVQGTRLYGKPLQNLDEAAGLTVIEHQLNCLKTLPEISEMVLAIAEGEENHGFVRIAERNGLKYIFGSEKDVLARLISCLDVSEGTDAFRVTTECPFPLWDLVPSVWERHQSAENDFTTVDHVPDGANFEIIRGDALRASHDEGEDRHRSELCSLFIRENADRFRIERFEIPEEVRRPDLRLTVDNPEDLILCRAVLREFAAVSPRIPVADIIRHVDAHPELKALVDGYVDEGLKTMYL